MKPNYAAIEKADKTPSHSGRAEIQDLQEYKRQSHEKRRNEDYDEVLQNTAFV